MPATSILRRALSAGMSGMGNSRISVLPGPVLTAANTFSKAGSLNGRLRHAFFCLERLAGAFLEGRAGGKHDRDGADFLVRGIAPRRQRALGGELLRRLHQAVPRHDDAVVRGDEILLGAILD